MKKKQKNPLFVVTSNGKNVEMAKNFWEFLLKKTRTEKVFHFLEEIFLDLFRQLLESVKNYATLIAVKDIIDKILDQLKSFPKFLFA